MNSEAFDLKEFPDKFNGRIIYMKKICILITLLIGILIAFAGGEGKKVAIVKLTKGLAQVIKADGEKVKATKGLWVEQGSVIKTEDKSFVKLSFVDKSTMNIGPSSEMKIEKFSKDEAGVINVISGKIRAKVSKDYLRMEKDKSKLFVKSKSAVMGIRGTDFAFTTNKQTGASTAVLFEGSVVFNKLDQNNNKQDLESVVNKGQRIRPGQFSVTRMDMKNATVPAKMNSKQIRALEKNDTFTASESKTKVSAIKNVVPPGLTGAVVSNSSSSLENGIGQVAKIEVSPSENKNQINSDSKGFVKGDMIKPVDGSIVHIDSGTVIPIGNDAVYDNNAGEWVSNSSGSVDDKGGYVPPESFKISDDGKILQEVKNGSVVEIKTDIKPLDEAKPLVDTTITKEESGRTGPAPASTDDTGVSNTIKAGDGEADSLPQPPRPSDTTIAPSTYNQVNPSAVEAIQNRKPTSKATIGVGRGN